MEPAFSEHKSWENKQKMECMNEVLLSHWKPNRERPEIISALLFFKCNVISCICINKPHVKKYGGGHVSNMS